MVVVNYSDGEGLWFKRVADKELYIYRSFSAVDSNLEKENVDTSEYNENTSLLSSDTINNNNIDATTTITSKQTKTKSKSKKNLSSTDTTTTTSASPSTSTISYNQQENLLSSLLDRKKWRRRYNQIKLQSKSTAINLVKLLTLRNNCHRVPCIEPPSTTYNTFRSFFKFSPTSDQLNCFQDINHDLIKSSKPMDRLVCGDVGFGKTEVAMHAMFIVVQSNRQVAVLSPTRVLALQHYRSIQVRILLLLFFIQYTYIVSNYVLLLVLLLLLLYIIIMFTITSY